MHLLKIPGALMVAVLLSACGARVVTSAPQLPIPSNDASWTLALEQTGGIAGVQLEVQVTGAGELTATNQRSGRHVTKSLPAATMAELRQLIAASHFSMGGGAGSICADCFNYDLKFVSSRGTEQAQADDSTLGSSGAQALIVYLRSLRDAALVSQP